jgi:hypothetical protein
MQFIFPDYYPDRRMLRMRRNTEPVEGWFRKIARKWCHLAIWPYWGQIAEHLTSEQLIEL